MAAQDSQISINKPFTDTRYYGQNVSGSFASNIIPLFTISRNGGGALYGSINLRRINTDYSGGVYDNYMTITIYWYINNDLIYTSSEYSLHSNTGRDNDISVNATISVPISSSSSTYKIKYNIAYSNGQNYPRTYQFIATPAIYYQLVGSGTSPIITVV